MSKNHVSAAHALVERLILSNLTAATWSDPKLRQSLYVAMQAKLASANTTDEVRQHYQNALDDVSGIIEAAAEVAADHADFLDLVEASKNAATPSPPDVPVVSPASQPNPDSRKTPAAEPNEPRLSAPVAQPVKMITPPPAVAASQPLPVAERAKDLRPKREIPIWPLMAAIAVAALVYAFWPASQCSLSSATCITDRAISSGPSLSDSDARKLRIAVLGLTSTPTHVAARVRVNNSSDMTVHAISPNPFRISYRLRPATQSMDALLIEQFNANRIELREDIPPGGTVELLLLAPRPANSTSQALDVSFVVEGRFWSFGIGVPPLSQPVP